MLKHEYKYCPRCGNGFECKVGSILLCQCMTVELSDEESTYIKEQFSDCLCAECLKIMKGEYQNKILKERIRKLLRGF